MNIGTSPTLQSKKDALPSKKRNSRIGIGLALLVALGAGLAFALINNKQAQPSKPTLQVSGRIEGDESHISTITPGRVLQVFVKEGQFVKKGQALVQIDDSAVRSGLNAADSAVAMAAKLLASVEKQNNSLQAHMSEVEAQATQEASPPPKKGPAKKVLHFLSAPVRLLVSPIAKANPAAAIKKQMNEAQLSSTKMMLGQSGTQILLAQSELEKARITRQQLSLKLAQYKILSPISGICTTCAVHTGDLATQGQALLIIVDPTKIFMRGFIPEGQIARIKIGQAAKIVLDSKKTKSLAAHVTEIDPAPSFTPENVYFKDDRVKQVFGLKLSIDKPDGSAKPGMPCDAEIIAPEADKNNGS